MKFQGKSALPGIGRNYNMEPRKDVPVDQMPRTDIGADGVCTCPYCFGRFVVNASVGKSWFVRGRQVGFSLQVNNMLNNRRALTGGYEQTRLISNADKNRYYRFDSKYFYMPGVNYMLNVYFRF